MRALDHRLALGVGLLAALCAPGCFAVADIDRFDFPAACSGTAADTRDFHWRITSLMAHEGDLFEMKVVDRTSRAVAAAVVYDPVPDLMPTTLEGTLTHALAPGSYEVRFWADLSGNGLFDPPPAPPLPPLDHSWIREIPDTGCFTFEHAGPFGAEIMPVDDATLHEVTVRFTGLGTFAERPLIFRVSTGPAERRTEVGFYRLDKIPATLAEAHDLTLFDLVAVEDTTYELHAFIDVDGDGLEGAGEPTFDPEGVSALPDAVFEIDLSPPPP